PYLQKPLTDVPDPFGTHAGFAQHNNARLCGFLDSFGFDYEFASATQLYRSGAFDATLLRALERFDEIMAVMLPSLGPERRATYSPFLPISPTTGRVLYVPMKAVDAKAGTITFEDEDGTEVTMPVTGGRAKMQWKPDFGMRWAALGVDFEMYGKDHQTNGPIYSKICRILGAEPPLQYCYELFLDQNGEKISKSKGNGISVEDWLTYAPAESLSLYNFQKPRTAKRLYFDVIPRAVDDYIAFLDAYPNEEPARQLDNPVWHIHAGAPPPPVGNGMTYGLLLKLVAAASSQSEDVLWGFIKQYRPELDRATHPYLDRLVGLAVAYYHDRILPHRVLRAPTDLERAAMKELRDYLATQGDVTPSAEDIQTQVFEIGKRHAFENLRDWFKALYEVLLGESDGPRFGTFAALVGAKRLVAQIDARLEGA
ncbi:MAG: lysine--tRNA ligase, partial [Pseudomonadota bacterium]